MNMNNFYDTILCQTLSPCGNFLVIGNIYGDVSVFNLHKIINTEKSSVNDANRFPINKFVLKKGIQVNSLVTTDNYLVCGGVGEISGFDWNVTKTSKQPKVSWQIDIPNFKDSIDKIDVNCMIWDKEKSLLYAACGDHKIYVIDLEGGNVVRSLDGHSDYVHCIHKSGNELVSGGEDGLVNIWDLREKQASNSITPYKKSNLVRPSLGNWIGAVSLNDDWLVCGGGPRLSLWHIRSNNLLTVFPIEDRGIHVATFHNDKIFAGGRASFFYQMSYNGEICAEIPTSSITTYSVAYQEEPFRVLSIAGSSPNIDLCSNFNYKDQTLYVNNQREDN